MRYIALLRGINISGKNKISMTELKNKFEELEFENVTTYLNSGNVIFDSDILDKKIIIDQISQMIMDNFKLDISVYILTPVELEDILTNSPKWWATNNKEIYDNLIFIIPPTNFDEVYDVVGAPNEDIEKIEEYNNSIFWSFDLNNYKKSNWWIKTASKNICNKLTIRTANTMKKVLEICKK